MSRAYPFPFTDAILEQFTESEEAPPVWERLLPDWTPDSGVPLHLAAMKEILYMSREVLWQIISQRISEVEDDQGRYYLEMTTNIISTCLDQLDDSVKLGLMTSHVDPVIVKAVKGNGDAKPIPVLDAAAHEQSLEAIRKKIRTWGSFRVVKQMRELFPVAPEADENTSLQDFAIVQVPLTESQFSMLLIGLSNWLDEYDGIPWAFKCFEREFGERPETIEWLGEVLSQAFSRLHSVFAVGAHGKDRFIDFSRLETPPRKEVLGCDVPCDLPASA